MTDAYFLAQLAIYAVLALPTLYLLWRHRPAGLLGWFFLFAFCTIRLVGGALASSDGSSGSGAIVASVGLSPLLLATAGILHEARIYRDDGLDRKMEWVYALAYHIVVVTGVALLAVGISDLHGPAPKTSDLVLVKIGISILVVAWGILVAWTGVSLLTSRVRRTPAAYREGTILLYSVCFALIFLAIRLFYSLAALTTGNPSLDPIHGTLAVRVVLSLLPELICVLGFLAAGIMTRNVRLRVSSTKSTNESLEMRQMK